MANPYFKFKQFTVYHDQCAMKVGVDGVLLGGWAEVFPSDKKILDVGTGSGLIALMMAQRSNAYIDAIDIDMGAYNQAKFNFGTSPWQRRLSAYHSALESFVGDDEVGYDLIISNPPYFVSSLKAPDEFRATARHADALSHESFIDNSIRLLKETGRICLILPVNEGFQCLKYAENRKLFCNKHVYVHPKPLVPAKRIMLELSFSKSETLISKIEIETNQRHEYSPGFSVMLKDFYLKL
ncbi:methyltransferase [Paludibacter sp.]